MVLSKVTFEDWGRFWSVFQQDGARMRREYGSNGVRVMRDADRPNEAWLLFDWERESIEEFLEDPSVRRTMKSGGATGPPEFHFVELVADLSA